MDVLAIFDGGVSYVRRAITKMAISRDKSIRKALERGTDPDEYPEHAIPAERANYVFTEMMKARAAIAELIHAAKELQEAMDEHDASPFDIGPSRRFIVADARHRAALANVGNTP